MEGDASCSLEWLTNSGIIQLSLVVAVVVEVVVVVVVVVVVA